MTGAGVEMAGWGFPVPVPPIRMRLGLALMKSPAASSRICPSSTGEPSKMKASRSFWESRAADAIVDRTGLAMSQFGADQTAEERIEFIAPRQPLAGDL